MKRFFSIIPILIILLLAGCTENELNQSLIKEDKIELEFFSPKPETEVIFNELIQEFEKLHPNVTIKQVIVPEPMTVLKGRIARGDIPDLFITYPIEQDYKVRAEKGYLLDLSNEPFIKNIQPTIQSRYLINGKMYGAALTQNAVGVLYNKDHFEELNLSVPNSWNSFVEVLEELKSNGKTALVMPNKDVNQASIFNLNLVANEFETSYWEKDEFSIVSDPRWRKISEKTLTVLSYVQPNSFEDSYYDVNKKFANGEGSMYIMGTWALTMIEKSNPYLNYGIFPFPVSNQTDQNVLGGVDIGFAISADTKHPEEAKAFLAFLIKKENAQRISNFDGSISAVKGVTNTHKEGHLIREKVVSGQVVNWPNHYWAGGTAAESEFRKYTAQFYYDHNMDVYLKNLEKMFNRYSNAK
ncbi:raffinose/stachyose/melibiose transport system substrate-binding protein [Bacillus niacini]|uniref:Raffinose/stachyose/melibiose transport system substrate-binding protein n=1 Tax=Neobacillus niacini TaxID=86668 RepID=A0A852TML5_9BACI|nr:extracellular solute-binding protein [Neobacillus niacini]NYE08388.1 raffinose/stachyose/melibiose transport system substrate-binding protein [Neobacillus niacini]